MVSSYTSNGRLTKQGTDDNPNTWGTVLNQQLIDLVDEAVFGVEEIDITGSGNITLTTANGTTDQARHATLELTGALGGDIDLLVPSVDKQYIIRGAWTGDYTVTIKISGSMTSVPLETGGKVIIYTNGTDTYNAVDLSAALLASNNLSDLTSASTARTNLGLGSAATQSIAQILESVYPVNSIYINTSVTTNPSSLLGFGTWVLFSEGRVLLGYNAADSDFSTLGNTGGTKEHTLTEDEVPAQTVTITDWTGNSTQITGSEPGALIRTSAGTYGTRDFTTNGGGDPHNNLPPYIVVCIWKRTA